MGQFWQHWHLTTAPSTKDPWVGWSSLTAKAQKVKTVKVENFWVWFIIKCTVTAVSGKKLVDWFLFFFFIEHLIFFGTGIKFNLHSSRFCMFDHVNQYKAGYNTEQILNSHRFMQGHTCTHLPGLSLPSVTLTPLYWMSHIYKKERLILLFTLIPLWFFQQ